VNRDRIVVLLVAACCLASYGALAGSASDPVDERGSYEVTLSTTELGTLPTSTGSSSSPATDADSESLSLDRRADWYVPVGALVVFGLWLAVAFRIMGAPMVVLFFLAAGVVLVVQQFVGFGGTTNSTTAVRSGRSLERLLYLLFGCVTVASAVAVLLPDDADYATVFRRLRSRLVARLDRLRADAEDPEPTHLSNEVHRLWWQFARRYGDAANGVETPTEIAGRARRAGLPSEAVDELRTVFEQVRYGDRPLTPEHVRRAAEAWERIEEAMGDE
jgi:hypothetical protein